MMGPHGGRRPHERNRGSLPSPPPCCPSSPGCKFPERGVELRLAAELVSARSGLGFVIVQGMNSGKASMVIAGMLLIALIASLCS